MGWHPNRAYIQVTASIVVDSCFPGGNIATAAIASLAPLALEIEGNTDISLDSTSKYWLYFRIRGFRRDRLLKFILKNANHLRKYLGQSRVRPYMVFREEGEENWQSLLTPIDLYVRACLSSSPKTRSCREASPSNRRSTSGRSGATCPPTTCRRGRKS